MNTNIINDTKPSEVKPLSIEALQEAKAKLVIQEEVTLQKALSSQNIDEIYKAQAVIEKREKTNSKTLLIDPLQLQSSFGYKDKPYSLSYDTLRGMSRTHVIKAIIETRKEQILSFCTPQKDRYSTGFIVQKKSKYLSHAKEVKLTKQQEERIEDIIEFLIGCGNTSNIWHADSFDVFVGKLVTDSLTYDQATFECVRNRRGELIEFFATPSDMIRVADSYDEDDRTRKEVEIKGHTPSYVQVYMGKVVSQYYPWELGFGVRNPTTDIRFNGYGRSELEDMIQTVTAILNSDFYNANFFKVGSSPKGILKYSGNINQNTVDDFKKQWINQVSGVGNMHKIPLINADKLDFINTMVNNKDMEFARYQEFLIKISCALYKIDPSEIGFPMSGSSDSKPMFEGNNEARLKYSRDKGLKPLLKRIESWINKWLVWQLDPEFEFRFVGIESDREERDDLEEDIQRLSNFMTLNEIRAKWNLPKDKSGAGDLVFNPIYFQAKQAADMQKQQEDQMNQQNGNQDNGSYDEQQNQEQASNPFTDSQNNEQPDSNENPFMKALEIELPRIFQENK